ncbi:TNF receptor-associated factor 4 isoform X3 [Oopsacas minuta]|uniref:TNF receptor-associated factor 4 isoform X3 n=1 Tax=Oopsacas minuta TaxID=111878 RepID=A0AAV7KGX2_9METZ|nr:TNF receptor-associated factor 4 isoform X3 [Oopsacas minuta]
MAAKYVENLEPEIAESLCRVRRKDGKLGGFRKDILVENISETEMAALLCNRCQGILRMACFSDSGEHFCKCCMKFLEPTYTNTKLRKIIYSLKSSCPLYNRGCHQLGKLGKCEKHMAVCEYVYVQCEVACEIVLPRHELKIHMSEICVQRDIPCEYCDQYFNVYGMIYHLNQCDKMPLTCEQRCGTVVCRENMAQHLENCYLVEEECKLGCGIVSPRDELEIHTNHECIQREIGCEHCGKNYKVCDMPSHNKECTNMPLPCKQKCGSIVHRKDMREKCRDMPNHLVKYQIEPLRCEQGCGILVCLEDISRHLDEECVEKKVECPFIKYKCEVGLIKRKELNVHLEEKRTEHTELKLSAMEEMVMEQDEMIRKMSSRFTTLCSITKTTELKWKIENVRDILSCNSFSTSTSPKYEVAGFKFNFNLSSYASINILFPSQETSKSSPGKLNWPFKAKFLFRMICHNDPNGILEYRSNIIEIRQEDCSKYEYISDPIAQINAEHATSMYYMIDGGIDLEIFVILQ